MFGSSGSLAVAPSLYANAGLDPVKQFAPVATFALLPHVMVVPAEQVPAKNVKEFIEYAKANAGKLNYGAGLGTPPHLLSTLFVRKANLDITYVPYQGAAQSVTDMLAGRTHFTIDGTVILMPQIKAGKFRAIGTARSERWPELPDVPTLVEQGFPDFTIDAWTGVVAPAGTPAPIIARLNEAIAKGLASPETKATLDRFSSIAKVSTPAEFGAFIEDQAKRWGELVRLTGAKIE
jgi:tripartite-type tricarboxylate transporter receptor subunit TctC